LSLAFSYWTIKPWFLTEGKTYCYIHPTFSWGFPTGRSFTAPSIAIKTFSGAVAREKKTSARGVSHAHPLLFFKFYFTLFLLASFYQKTQKKLVSFIVAFIFLLLVLLE
jgi:hypothetical protein